MSTHEKYNRSNESSDEHQQNSCQFCHVVNHTNRDKLSKTMNYFKCLECNNDMVPEIIIATIDPPEGLSIIGRPKFIEARILKNKKKSKGAAQAISVSEKLFFIEY